MGKAVIAIDGPAGAGKSTVAKFIAHKLGYAYLDTGAMYRAVTYEALQRGLTKAEDIIAMTEKLHMEVVPTKDGMHVVVDGRDVTPFLRSGDVSAGVSSVSAIGGVRRAMTSIQRKQAEQGGIVLDGRDIGTTVLPHADVKVFLTASVSVRAVRRFKQADQAAGMTLEQVEADIKKRDDADSTRAVSPLRRAADAILLDNGHMTLEETADAIIALCKEKEEQ